MKAQTTRPNPFDVLGNRHQSEHEIFSSVRKQWHNKVGYCSMLAVIPSLATSQLTTAYSAEGRQSESNVAERVVSPQTVNLSTLSGPELLKSQSRFRLPHQRGSLLAMFGGNDNCPGKPIPGGNYTAASPYLDTGDTTGANDTVNSLYSFYYSSYFAHGPDHVYSFTLSGLGANPEIRVSTSSSTYKPMVYLLTSGCPGGTGNETANSWAFRYSDGADVTFKSDVLSHLPLNVRFYLFVDSPFGDSRGSGPYALRVQDVTIASSECTSANPIDCPEFFVHQHYLDFLSREAEQTGLDDWLNVLTNCALGDHICAHEQRLVTSAAFLGSAEFQLKGYFVFRFYRVAFDRLPEFAEIAADMQSVTGQTPDDVYARKANFTGSFAQRPEFVGLFNGLPNADYVAALLGRYGLTSITTPNPTLPDGVAKVTLTQAQLISGLDGETLTRGQVLRAIADSDQVFQAEFNQAFVAMQYYGYLRRTPESTGYNDWLNYLNAHPKDFLTMVHGFVNSIEYRARFGPP